MSLNSVLIELIKNSNSNSLLEHHSCLNQIRYDYFQTKEDVATLTDHIIVCVFGDINSPTVGLRNLVSRYKIN